MLLRRQSVLIEHIDAIYCDAISSARFSSLCLGKVIPRISFDYGSLAMDVFALCGKYQVPVFFLGGSAENIERAVTNVKEQHPDVPIAGHHHGYIDGDEDAVVQQIIASGAQYVIIGMGTIKQEQMAQRVIAGASVLGVNITCFTCGGFLTQASEKLQYYPQWINRAHLRWLWRLCKEEHVLGRLLREYPKFVYYFLKDRFA